MIKKVKKGFTLIELVVVIAVIAILSAVSVVAYVGITRSAKQSTLKQEADQMATAFRAAAQSSADGYSEQVNQVKIHEKAGEEDSDKFKDVARYNVKFVDDHLHATVIDASLTPTELLKDMFSEIEEKEVASTLTSIDDVEIISSENYKATEDLKPVAGKTYYTLASETYSPVTYKDSVSVFPAGTHYEFSQEYDIKGFKLVSSADSNISVERMF